MLGFIVLTIDVFYLYYIVKKKRVLGGVPSCIFVYTLNASSLNVNLLFSSIIISYSPVAGKFSNDS